MPRFRRLFVPGGYFHIIQRGVNRGDIFVDDVDRRDFLDGVATLSTRFGHRVHAYCLMSNHVHLALQCGHEPLGKGLRSLFGRYARRFNWRHGRSGHLFQERHRAILVATDGYLLELVRYIHLNPVRAALVQLPEDYRWSSFRTYARGGAPGWLTTDTILGRFAENRTEAGRHFAAFVHQGMGKESSLDFIRGNSTQYDALVPDGYSSEVVDRVARREAFSGTLENTELRLCSRFSLFPEDLRRPERHRSPALVRNAMAYLAQWGAGWTMVELARRYARSESAISTGASRFSTRLAEDGELRSILAEVMGETRDLLRP